MFCLLVFCSSHLHFVLSFLHYLLLLDYSSIFISFFSFINWLTENLLHMNLSYLMNYNMHVIACKYFIHFLLPNTLPFLSLIFHRSSSVGSPPSSTSCFGSPWLRPLSPQPREADDFWKKSILSSKKWWITPGKRNQVLVKNSLLSSSW